MGDEGAVEALVRENLATADRIARRYARRFSDVVPTDDLRSLAHIGLLEAARRYDPAGGTPFMGYARARIHGAVMDGIRRALGYATTVADDAPPSSSLTPIELLRGGYTLDASRDTADLVAEAQLASRMADSRLQLTDEQRQILDLRYDLGLSFADIAERLGYPITRVRNLHAEALEIMRAVVAD